MEMILAEILPPTQIPYPIIFARLLGAILFGAILGFEREVKARPAGLKTHILVSLAAALFAIISIVSSHMPGLADEQVRIDPLRVIEAVTAGVAFLAAGTIIMSRGRVLGLTTGASLWLAGAIGLATGMGYWPFAAFVVVVAFAVLTLVSVAEHRYRDKSEPHLKPESSEIEDRRREEEPSAA